MEIYGYDSPLRGLMKGCCTEALGNLCTDVDGPRIDDLTGLRQLGLAKQKSGAGQAQPAPMMGHGRCKWPSPPCAVKWP